MTEERKTKAWIQTKTRAGIAQLYNDKKETEVTLRTFDLISAALSEGYHTGEITIRLIDLGVKQVEIVMALCLALEKFPTEKLNDIDKLVQIHCQDLKVQAESYEL